MTGKNVTCTRSTRPAAISARFNDRLPCERTGTSVTFYASDDIFETTTYNFETITNRIREMAFLNKGLEIVVRDERSQADEIADAVEDDTVEGRAAHQGPEVEGTTSLTGAAHARVGDLLAATVVGTDGVDLIARVDGATG